MKRAMLNIDNEIEYVKIVIRESGAYYITKNYRVGEKTISLNVETDNRIYLKTPQDVFLCYITNDAMYKAETQLLSLQYSNYMAIFVAKLPDSFEKQQERKDFRVKWNSEAKITYKENGVLKTLDCRTVDLSAGGVRLMIKERPQIVENVKITIMPDNQPLIVEARPVKLFYDGKIPQASFEFIGLSEKDSYCISSFCFKQQINNRNSKKGLF